MSDPLTVGIVADGPTDQLILDAVLSSLSGPVRFMSLQPETSVGLAAVSSRHGMGWRGVLSWCQHVTARSGNIAAYLDSTFGPPIDMLVIHLDVDIAGDPEIGLEVDCPPAAATAAALRDLLATRLGGIPTGVVLALPSKATEAWILQALSVERGRECPCDELTADARELKTVVRALVERVEEDGAA